MKNYKEFRKVYIGFSDVAALTVQACDDDGIIAFPISFGADGGYNAYLVEGRAKIGEHYKLIKSVNCAWFNIFDDEGKKFSYRLKYSEGAETLKIWRSGEYGIILQICSKEGE